MEQLNEFCQFRDMIEASDAKLREFIELQVYIFSFFFVTNFLLQ